MKSEFFIGLMKIVAVTTFQTKLCFNFSKLSKFSRHHQIILFCKRNDISFNIYL
jgi:hypothetical protein